MVRAAQIYGDESVVMRGSQDPNPVFPLGAAVQCSQTQGSQQFHKTDYGE